MVAEEKWEKTLGPGDIYSRTEKHPPPPYFLMEAEGGNVDIGSESL